MYTETLNWLGGKISLGWSWKHICLGKAGFVSISFHYDRKSRKKLQRVFTQQKIKKKDKAKHVHRPKNCAQVLHKMAQRRKLTHVHGEGDDFGLCRRHKLFAQSVGQPIHQTSRKGPATPTTSMAALDRLVTIVHRGSTLRQRLHWGERRSRAPSSSTLTIVEDLSFRQNPWATTYEAPLRGLTTYKTVHQLRWHQHQQNRNQ